MSLDIIFQFEDGSEETFNISCERFYLLSLCQSYGRSHDDNMNRYRMYDDDKETRIFSGYYEGNIVSIMFYNCVQLNLVNDNRYINPVRVGIFDV
jgi:hypothetical protein